MPRDFHVFLNGMEFMKFPFSSQVSFLLPVFSHFGKNKSETKLHLFNFLYKLALLYWHRLKAILQSTIGLHIVPYFSVSSINQNWCQRAGQSVMCVIKLSNSMYKSKFLTSHSSQTWSLWGLWWYRYLVTQSKNVRVNLILIHPLPNPPRNPDFYYIWPYPSLHWR